MGRMLLRAFDKTVWTYSLGVCGGRGPYANSFTGGKGRWEDAPGLCRGAQLMTPFERKLVMARKRCEGSC